MSTNNVPIKAKYLGWGFVLACCVIFTFVLPLVHFESLQKSQQMKMADTFNVVTYVDELWNESLPKVAAEAIDAIELFSGLRKDAKETEKKFGHKFGLGNSVYFFVSGQGKVVSIENDTLTIALENDSSVSVQIELGPVFGNAIRDGSGLLNLGDFSNIEEFNAISTELNRRVEENVLSLLIDKVIVGSELKFVGGVEIADSEVPSSITLVPVDVKIL
jgi:predicted lipoprotein